MDGAILVCSAAEGITEEASEHLRLAYRAGVRYVVVFLSNVDGKDDQSDIGTPSIVKLVDVPLVSGFRLQYYLKQVSPGEHAEVDVELTYSMVVNEGLRFVMRKDGRTVGIGVIAKEKWR